MFNFMISERKESRKNPLNSLGNHIPWFLENDRILSKLLAVYRKSQMRKQCLVSVAGSNSSIHFSAFGCVCVHYQSLYLATSEQRDSTEPGFCGVE